MLDLGRFNVRLKFYKGAKSMKRGLRLVNEPVKPPFRGAFPCSGFWFAMCSF